MNRSQVIDVLKARIDEALVPLVPQSGELILLDFPNHANVGDSAIYLGELEFFQHRLGRAPSIVSDCNHIPVAQIESTDSRSPIFLHGGGNFGDIWPTHQAFREEVIQRFPDRPIVQLPQSLHFASSDNLSRTADVIRQHRNFTLLVRDDASFELAQRHFACQTLKCPDMAFYLGAMKPLSAPKHDLLLLLRDDREQRQDVEDFDVSPGERWLRTDWIDDNKSLKTRAKLWTAFRAVAAREFSEMAAREAYYRALAIERVERGNRLLSSASFVITDRLHAHIISLLLDLPQVVLDNSYGKVSRFIKLWTHDYEKLQQADSIVDALSLRAAQTASLP